jgi:UDP-glucose 4-epimerase
MRALVTGGAGFIGSHIVRQWLDMGHEAVVLDNLSSGYARNLEPEVEFIEGDIRDEAVVEGAIKDCEVVFNLAASVGNKRAIDNPLDDSDINVLGLLQVLEAARRHGIKKIVQSSSAGIFGELITLPIAEYHPQEPDTPYGVSKLAGEKHCLAYNKLYGMENVCLRYFNVYGPHQRFDAYGNVIPIFATRALTGEPIIIFGDGEQTRDFVHVRDVAAANIRSALGEGVQGVFNIGSATRVTINELASLVIAAAGVEVEVVHGPVRPGDVRDSLADVRAAQATFGYIPVENLFESLKEYLDWLKADRLSTADCIYKK